MNRSIVLMVFLAATTAHAVDLSGIPQNCQAPLAHDMEMTNIPYLLDLGPNAARIKSIETAAGTPAYEYYPGLYRIDCYVTVHWSNGTVDYMHKFSLWQDRYGSLQGSYSQH
ncbi:hypothetical protein J2801_003556 [Paraburkholderia phenoliruptrix]|uniref:hypothetical protein n=1 Tax=Paraburkholderia phenoliruptrix TaxID=252970 RepID=UPI00285E9ECC|nr:hypothetical protein [Paraburkholderia phenoliruptrix]MDR6421268.1 hypothetical protein [Paraburkholderia phenoliruptrix]